MNNDDAEQFDFSSVASDSKAGIHPNDFIQSENLHGSANTKEAILGKMEAEDDKIRNLIQERRKEAERKDKELQQIISALKSQGYDSDQINSIFNDGMLTPELIDELLSHV